MKIVIITLLSVGLIGSLGYLAVDGSTVAAYAMGVITGVGIMSIGFVFELIRGRQQARQQQQAFQDNARENLGLMMTQQRLMNAQNSQLMKQNREYAKAHPAQLNGGVDVLDGVFDELEQ